LLCLISAQSTDALEKTGEGGTQRSPEQPCRPSHPAFGIVVVASGLLHGGVLALGHGFGQGHALTGRLGEEARAQPVGREADRIEPRHGDAALEDQVDALAGETFGADVLPLVDPAEDGAALDPGEGEPGLQCDDGRANDKDAGILIGVGGLGATETDAPAGQGRGGGIAWEREPGSESTSGSTTMSSWRRPATSERRRPPEAKAMSSSALSRRSCGRFSQQVSISLATMSPVTAFSLLRWRGRAAARTDSLSAVLIWPSPKGPDSPRHLCIEPQSESAASPCPVHKDL